jgi:mono/diheme cytochrome c family protein
MPNLARSILSSVVFGALVAPLPGNAQQHGSMPGMNKEETKSTAPYHPGLGELMTAFVQPRHIKLGLAGNEQNWAYAGYELDELRESFDDVGKLVPKHGNLAIPAAIASTVRPPMAALDAAIKAKDPAAFTEAYGELTASCNACHQSGDHPMIVIQVPSGSPFPDQDFRPPKP